MTSLSKNILGSRIVAIIRLPQYDQAVEIASALLAGGISVIEFTLTGSGAVQALTQVRQKLGDRINVGVGTVLTPDQAREAIDVGAQFVVTPVMRPAIISTCQELHTPIICGALTPTEALTAHEAGAEFIKIFPIRSFGPSYIRDLLAPLPQLRLVPTGGIDLTNSRSYIQAGAVAVGIGGNLVPQQAVASQNWGQITANARRYIDALQGAE
jgi:2-dehydro-3-deoxyphosphogluconate aldolase/(4S)-4-hydroxy-2-oxoglutarate aldolase